jgi:uncharacterized protein (TIGR02246 family)
MTSQGDTIRALYDNLINGWNNSDAAMMTRDFADHAHMIGYDGSQVSGRARIRDYLASIFSDHQVARFVTLVREVREIVSDVVVLRAEVGMVAPGTREVHPQRNAVQTLIAAKRIGKWQIELFQNTPAAWHGREADVQALTRELQAAFDAAHTVTTGAPQR